MSTDPANDLKRYIEEVLDPVTPGDVDTYVRLSQIHAQVEEGRGQRQLRYIYGIALLVILTLQIIAVTVFAYLLGFGVIQLDRWVTASFIGGTLGEVSGMTYLVVRYLFPLPGGNTNND